MRLRPFADEILHPEFRATPFWWEAAAPTTDGTSPLPAETDVAVIGGGLAGLSAALELARNGTGVVVLEAETFGHGASSRNGGAVSGGINLGKGLSGARNRPHALLADAAAAFDHVERLIADEGIQCQWERTGRFVGAYTHAHYRNLLSQIDVLNQYADAGIEAVPFQRQREEIASDYYRGGIVVRKSAQLQPALFHRGLYHLCRRWGVTLCAGARVRRIAHDGGRHVLSTTAGTLRAREVVVATNGYTTDVTPALRRRVIPVASHIIATEELDPELARSLIPRRRTISDTRRVLCYYRLCADGRRMLFGGRARFTSVAPSTSATLLHRFMTDRFPQLRHIRVTHAWTGNVAFTFDFLPHMGIVQGLHYCLGCNGSGVAMMTYLGHESARKILGRANRVNAFDGREFPGHPAYHGVPWFLPLVGGYYRTRDAVDRWLDGKTH